jgi:hypothetical protein
MAEVRVDDLKELWNAGAVKLPQVAVQYSEMAGGLHKSGLSEDGGFGRPGYSPTGGTYTAMGRLGYAWVRLRNLVQNDIAVRSHNNLIAAGEALAKIADSYATTDYLNSDQIDQYNDYVESIETSSDSYRRPPYVPDAPDSNDPHPEEQPIPTGGYY